MPDARRRCSRILWTTGEARGAWLARATWAVLAAALAAGPAPAEEPAAAPERAPGGGSAATTEAPGDAASAPGPSDTPWALPAPGFCEPTGGLRGWPLGEDAPPLPVAPGDVLDLEAAPRIAGYLPPQVWEHRDKFFFEGMRLEIGPCFRDYAPPAFFQEATEKLAGRATLIEKDGLADHTAGLPFPPGRIDPEDPKAGLRWAWNVAMRYQGAGFHGPFRLMDMVGRDHRGEPFEGEIFKIQLAFRADQAEDGYTARDGDTYHWVAGGLFLEPTNAREYAWRQYRRHEHLRNPGKSDDLHAYLPQWRRVRRITAVGVEGLYMPSFSVGVVPASQIAVASGAAGDASAAGGGGAIGTGDVTGAISPRRNGFEGLAIRPLLYEWKVRGLQDVLTPINAKQVTWPAVEDRNFGPWGLSFASDRWELRRALVLEARAHGTESASDPARILHYLDLQTLRPLYFISWDARGNLLDVGMHVGRWSEDRPDYPGWPDDPERPVRVLDPVGAAFANVREQGGWRRESWTLVSTPPPDRELQQLLSVGQLTRRR